MVDLEKARQTLVDVCQLLQGWHADTDWTEWDSEVDRRVHALLDEVVSTQRRDPNKNVKGDACSLCGGTGKAIPWAGREADDLYKDE